VVRLSGHLKTGPTLPCNFVAEVFCTKKRIHQDLQIVACRRVAVQVQAPRRLQHPMKFQEANGHHGEVRHHVVLFQECPHGPQHFRRLGILPRHHPIEGKLRFIAPVPGIAEGFNPSAGPLPRGAAKKDVVRGLAVEWGIEVDEIHALIVNTAAQDRQVVAVVEPVH